MLRSAANAVCAPVHALPDEVLSIIFEDILPASSADKGNIRAGRFAFTYVCQRWRSVALSCPRLWTQIPLHAGPEWMHAFLDRSKAAIISIFGGYGLPWPTYVQSISDHISRVGELTQKAFHSEHDQMYLDFAQRQLPYLKTAELTIMPYFADKLDATHLVLPDMFLRHAPALEELKLEQFTLFWPSLQWTQLRSLTLMTRRCHEDLQANTFDGILQCLRAAVQLERMQLEYCLPNAPEASQAVVPQVALTRLRYLALRDDAQRCLALWRALDVPSRTIVHICLQDLDASQIDFSFAAILLHRHLHASEDRLRPRYLRLRADNASFELRGWRDRNARSENGVPREMAHGNSGDSGLPHLMSGRLDGCPSFCINVPSFYSGAPTANDVDTLLAACPFTHLEAFSAMTMGKCEWYQLTWSHILPSADSLIRLYITGRESTEAFCAQLTEDTKTTYLPCLRELHIDRVKLYRESLAGQASESALLALIQRMTLQTLVLSMCQVHEEQLELLKELVDVQFKGLGLARRRPRLL